MPTTTPATTTVICSCCESEVPRANTCSTAHDNRVCDDCIDNSYSQCDSCSEYFNEASGAWGNGRDGYCEDCTMSMDEQDEYSFPDREWKEEKVYPKGEKGKIMQSTRLFGVESEISYRDDCVELNEAAKELDKCIGIYPDSGAEFQTPPRSGHYAENLIEHMAFIWREHKFTAVNGQGLHVHIDCSELENMSEADRFDRIQGLWLLYIVFDKTIRSFTNQYRQGKAERDTMYGKNIYQFEKVLAAKNQTELEQVWYNMSDLNAIDSIKKETKHGTRYKGFNLHSLFNAYHLEIRYHESVTEAKEILEWANLQCLMMDKAMAGISREWLIKANTISLKRKRLFDFLDLAKNSRTYFRKKSIACAS